MLKPKEGQFRLTIIGKQKCQYMAYLMKNAIIGIKRIIDTDLVPEVQDGRYVIYSEDDM